MFSFIPKSWCLLLLAAFLALFGWGCLSGCKSPASEEQVAMFGDLLEQRITALKAAGVHGYVGAYLSIDKVGSIKHTLEGPGVLTVMAFAEVDPTAPDALEYGPPATQPARE